jgi:anti-sigma B factor antagonist
MNSLSTFASRFEIDDDNRIVIVTLAGEVDPDAVADLHPQIQELVQAGFLDFVFDLSATQRLGSVTLRLFVSLSNQLWLLGTVALCAVPEPIQSLIDLTKLDRVLTIEPTREHAIETITGARRVTSRLDFSRPRPRRRW